MKNKLKQKAAKARWAKTTKKERQDYSQMLHQAKLKLRVLRDVELEEFRKWKAREDGYGYDD